MCIACVECLTIRCVAYVLALAATLSILWGFALLAAVVYPDVFDTPVVAYDVPFASSLAHFYFPSPPPPQAQSPL